MCTKGMEGEGYITGRYWCIGKGMACEGYIVGS